MKVLLAVLVSGTVTFAPAQAPAPASSRTMVSASDVAAMIAKAKAERKDQPNNRASVGNAAVHETEAELFYVVDGSATLVTGGTLTESTRTGANLTGKGIQGGLSRKVAKGDFVMVPEGQPHWFSAIDGTVVLMSLHLPHAPGAK
jgi:mannose-6-phosphate isomerase-like protein (cupin superfamily)